VTLRADNVSFAYPRGPEVLRGVSCAIERGAVTVILGPNGAGKSTLVRAIAGVRRATRGSVTIDARDLRAMSAHERAHKVAYVAQRSSLAFDFGVRRVVELGRFGVGRSGAAVDAALARFALTDLSHRSVGSLSVGQRQRVALARAWAQLDGRDDAYILCDEPTSAMDPEHQLATLGALRELAARGAGVAIVMHDLTLAARTGDRALVLGRDGTVAAAGDAGTVLSPETLGRVFGVRFGVGAVDGARVVTPLGAPGAAS